VQVVVHRTVDERVVIGQTGEQESHRTQITDRVGEGHSFGKTRRAPTVESSSSGMTTTKRHS